MISTITLMLAIMFIVSLVGDVNRHNNRKDDDKK